MAQAGNTPILLYASGTASSVPLAANLITGANGAELALNYADGKQFYKNSSNVVTLLASTAGASGDVVGPSSATNNNLAAFDGVTGKLIKQAATVSVAQGGTGLTTYTANGVLYASAAGTLANSTGLTFDSVNVRLGVSETSPTVPLQVKGASETVAIFNNNDTSVALICFYNDNNSVGDVTIGAESLSFVIRIEGSNKVIVDDQGSLKMIMGPVMPYAPAPASISTTATLTNANIRTQIINTTGTSYTLTMPTGTTLESSSLWFENNIGYDFYVINTASGTITMAANTGVTTLGALTIATGTSAQFRIRRTAASTFVLYRLG